MRSGRKSFDNHRETKKMSSNKVMFNKKTICCSHREGHNSSIKVTFVQCSPISS